MSKKTSKFDVAAFAASTPDPRRFCKTCTEWPEAAKTIREFLELKRDQGSRMSLKHLYPELQTHFGYTLSRDAMMRHCKACEADLYSSITGVDHG
jgi:hypothetical protein